MSKSDVKDFGDVPEDFVDPIENPELPWITAATDDDQIPPEYRLDDEPDEVEAEDNGQNEHLASALRGPKAAEKGGPRSYVPSAVGVNLRDYSRNAQNRGWGAPCASPRARVAVGAAAINVDARLAELIGIIMRNAEGRGYRHRAVDTGAYNCRKIAGTNTWSNHAWAVAVDINWQSNPYTSVLRTDIPEWYRHMFNRYGFAWGGDYSGKKDAMHFEFMGTPFQAGIALALARRELLAPPPTPPGAVAGDGILEEGDTGESVKTLQRVMKAWYPNDLGYVAVDGDFGPNTKRGVQFVQGKFRITQDGVAGPVTLGKLGLSGLR